jgi:long-chain acyl-CoA synthetase
MESVISSGQREASASSLRERALRCARGLADAGVSEGGVIALLLRNDMPFLEAMLATDYLGAYSVPINWHYTGDEVSYILTDSQSSHLIVHADLLREIRDHIPKNVTVLCVETPPEIRAAYGIADALARVPDDCLEWESWLARQGRWQEAHRAARGRMCYTSGTTGRPKGVKREPPAPEHTKAYAQLSNEWFGFKPGMRTAMIGPMYHSVQAGYAISAVRAFGNVSLLPRFDAEAVLQLIEEQRLTHIHLVPIMMNRLLKLPRNVRERYDLSSLRFVVHGAAPCSPATKREMIRWWGPILHEYYGTTEVGMVSRASSEEWLARPGTVGRAWPGRAIRILDDDGRALPAGKEGHVFMTLGSMPNFTYHNAAAKRASVERDGLVTNGDIGYLDEDGYLFLCDRAHDMVISGGTNIYPAEIEAELSAHAAVSDCAVFGIPDDEFGETVAAVVQLQPGADASADELRAFLAKRLAKFKLPRHFEFQENLPRDDSGKIFKRVLRDKFWTGRERRI